MRQDAKDNYHKIKQHALSLFNQYGVENVSMHQIAKSLNIGSGTLYRHFKDKGVLCFDLLEDDFNTLFEHFNDVLSTEDDDYNKLDAMLHAILLFKHRNEDLLLCIEQHEMKYLFKETPHYKQLFTAFEIIFKDQFKTDILLNALTTRSFQHQVHYRELSLEDFKQQLLKLFTTQL
ncbi:TetR/AcrR family transcriptional regulator [Macrococcus armenti]|uniref:TetR/AcrR family transcriptional regulator n=1 Tax=Macrococcus armenti TaxID=2875764 RepID=A0ABY3ZXJ8_9STAP|nr:TetR/AcrR family transcriptional regulator [Macrococcus armenti]UOB20576.1 TetR/AcrR family transcriptional regulator [Macrococcus armenti]